MNKIDLAQISEYLDPETLFNPVAIARVVQEHDPEINLNWYRITLTRVARQLGEKDGDLTGPGDTPVPAWLGSRWIDALTFRDMDLFWTPQHKSALDRETLPLLPTFDGLLVLGTQCKIKEAKKADSQRIKRALEKINLVTAFEFCSAILKSKEEWEEPVLKLAQIGSIAGDLAKDFAMEDLGFICIVSAQKIIDLARYPAKMRYALADPSNDAPMS